jgi:hypothetical protein
MSVAVSHAQEQAGGLEPRRGHPDVMRCVRQQERLEALVPKLVMGLIFGGPAAYLLIRAGGLTGGVIIGAASAFFAAGILNAAVRIALLQPSRRIRYGAAAKKLAARIASDGDLSMPPMSWFRGSPGALAVSRDGSLVVAARGTGYEQLRLSPRQIADVRVERDVAHVTSTRHSGRTVVGGSGGALMGAHVSGGRSTSVTRTVEDVCIELAYQLEPNGAVGTIIVPFGDDRCRAEATAALIRRLQGQP